jgi:type VII secretion protein EccE
MAQRRGSTDKIRPDPAAVQRVAAPGRELVSLTPRTGMAVSALATCAMLGTWELGPGVAIGSVTATVAAFGARVAGRTLGQRVTLRREYRRLPEQAVLFSRDGVGVVFDGLTATALVEMTARPWQLTTVSATGASQTPVLSADVLRRQLRQFDINVSGLDIVCAGYKFAARDNAAAALDTLIGPVSVPLGGVTVIAVSLNLEADVLGPAYRRARRESLPDGLCQALTIAATRVSHALAEQGFGGRMMNAAQVRDFHDAILVQVARPLARPGWRYCGSRSGVHTRTFVPARGHWNAESAGAWNHLQAHRQYTTLSLTPTGAGQALAQPLVTYLVRGSDALTKATGYGLRPAMGHQVAALGRTLPVSARKPLRSVGAVIDDNHRLGFGVPAGGAGMFVGSRADKTRVFVAVSAAVEPLWLVGPPLFAMQMVARLSTQDQRIAVMIDEPGWHELAAHRDTPVLTVGTAELALAAVVVCTPQWWERHRERCDGKAVMLVADEDPGRGAVNSLAVTRNADGCSEIAVSVDGQTMQVLWELTPIERRALLGDAGTAGDTLPREGTYLRLDPVVDLPAVTVTRPAPRRSAPAPEVVTVGQAPAPGQVPPPGADRQEAKPPRRDRRPAANQPLVPPRSENVTSPPGVKVPPRRVPRKVPVKQGRVEPPRGVAVPGRVVQPGAAKQPAPPPRQAIPPGEGRHRGLNERQ